MPGQFCFQPPEFFESGFQVLTFVVGILCTVLAGRWDNLRLEYKTRKVEMKIEAANRELRALKEAEFVLEHWPQEEARVRQFLERWGESKRRAPHTEATDSAWGQYRSTKWKRDAC